MHEFFRHLHNQESKPVTKETKGLILNSGWRYDLMEWFFDRLMFHGKLNDLRMKTADLAGLQPGETVLDVGCGTGTLAIEAQQRVGMRGRVVGIDPGDQQIARARSKAAKRNLPIDFQTGVIEKIVFPDETFDVVLNTIMMHHLGDGLKRQGLSEIARVLKSRGRLVIADFKRPDEHWARPAPFGTVRDLPALVSETGFSQVDTMEMPFLRISSSVIFVKAVKT